MAVFKAVCCAVVLGTNAIASARADGPRPVVPAFVDVTSERGLGVADPGTGYGAGAAIADFDDDGDLDIWLGTGAGVPDQVWRNRGDGVFDDVAADLGLASTASARTALWIDFSGDGRLDLVVGGDCFSPLPDCLEQPHLRFHRQQADGTFVEVTATLGPIDDAIDETGAHRSGLVAGDLDGDGWLDLVGGAWRGTARVLLADGRGGFIDASARSGIESVSFHHWQPLLHDFDRDGRPDIHWAVDFTPNHLWRNRGDGTFEDLAPALGLDNAMNDMGSALGDIDDDGDFDLFVTQIHSDAKGLHNVLFRNDTVAGEMSFTEIAVPAGVSDAGFGWGATFLDVNHDRRLDLAVTNGWFNGVGFDDRTRLFVNEGSAGAPAFVDRAAEAGLDDDAWGVTILAFDMDRDGDLDLLETRNFGFPVRLLENRLEPGRGGHRSLTVLLRQPGANRDAVGATIRAEVAGEVMARRISAGTSHLGQEPPEAHFGLGSATVVERLVVHFPDGSRVIRRDVPAGMATVHRSPCAGTADQDGDGRIDFTDVLTVLATWGPCPTACPEDVDGSGGVDAADLAVLVAAWGPCTGG